MKKAGYEVLINPKIGNQIKAKVFEFKNKEDATESLKAFGIEPSNITGKNLLI